MGYATGSISLPDGGERSRRSKRISMTLSYVAYQALEERSAREGRSISNLAAYLVERALQKQRELRG